MNTKNTFVKKLTALVLCLCMVLPMVTTGFAPMMALLDGIVPQADAAVTEKGKVAFYVPEVIYLYPEALSSAKATATPFQYYVENTVNTSSIYAQPTPNTTLNTSGTIYFASEDGFSDVSIATRFCDANGNTISGGSVTTVAFSNKTSYGTFAVTAGTSPSLEASTTGCYLEWTVSYTNNAGERQSAIAYSYVYKPYIYPVAGGANAGTGTSGGANWAGQITWISGIHSATYVDSSLADDWDDRYTNYYTNLSNFASFISQDNVGYVNGTRYTGSQAKITSGFTVSPSSSGGSLGYAVFTGSSASGYYLQIPGNSTPSYAGSSTAGTYTSPVSNYDVGKYRANAYNVQSCVYQKSYGNLFVDTSRYSNLNEIPNLAVGMMVTDDERSDGNSGTWYVADYTDRTPSGYDTWHKDSDNRSKYYDDKGTVIASQGTSATNTSYNETEGIRYAGVWPRTLLGNKETAGAQYTYRFKGFYGNKDGSYYASSHVVTEMKATYYNKSTLRAAVNNAINAMGTLGLKDNYGSYYYDTNNAAWTAFKTAYRNACVGLTKLDGSCDVSGLATALNNAVTALKNGQGRKIFFDVNYGGINPNLYILGSVTDGGYGLTVSYGSDESITLNGTISGSNAFGTTPFTPKVGTYTFSSTLLSGSKTGDGCVVLDSGDENGSNVSSRTNFDFTGSAVSNKTYSLATAKETDLLRFWQWKNTQNDVYSNLKVRIKVEKGSTKTAYSPAARIATTSGTYGILPTPDERPGYTFEGWYQEPACTNHVTSTSTVESDTLYAKWTPNEQTLTIDSNGGVNSANLIYNPDGKQSFSGGSDASLSYNIAFDENGAVDIYGNYTGGVTERTSMVDLWVYLEYGKMYEYSFTSTNDFTEFYMFPNGEVENFASLNRKTNNSTTYGGQFVCGGSGAVGDNNWNGVTTATGWYQLRLDQDCKTTSEQVVTAYEISDFVIREVTPDATSIYKQPTDTKIYIPDPVRGGYTFSGWTGAGAGNLGADKYYTFKSGSNTLVANWTANTYTITYNANGGTLTGAATQDYTPDAAVTIATAPTKTGYTFSGWLVTVADGNWVENSPCNAGEQTPTGMYGNVTLTAQWSKNSYTYTVEHRQQNLDGATYTTVETETVTLDTEDTHTFAVKSYTGFTSPQAVTVTVDGTGELTVVYNYTRNKYKVTTSVNNNKAFASVTGAGEYYYGATVTLTANVNAGYTFTNWTKNGTSDANTSASFSFTLGAADVAWTANATAQNVSYTVIHKYEKLTDNVYDEESQTLTAEADSSVTPAFVNKEGFTAVGNTQTVTVKGDGSTVVTYIYTRNTYTFTTDVDGLTTPVEYKYGATVTAPETPTKVGYTFAGWDGTVPATMPAYDVTVTATWNVNTHTIIYKVDGAEVQKYENVPYGSAVTAYTYTAPRGYEFNGWSEIPAAMPDNDLTINGTTTKLTYTIKATVDDEIFYEKEYQVDTAEFTIPDPVKTGYTFTGWTENSTNLGTGLIINPANKDFNLRNMNLVATWEAASVKYTVETYVMDTDGSYGTPTTETKQALTGTTATADTTAKTGFTLDTNHEGYLTSGTVKADGSLVLKVFYKRNQYTVNLTAGQGVASVNGAGTFYYEAPVSITATLKDGYENLTWSGTVPTTMPNSNVDLTATASPIGYTISYDLAGGAVSGTNPTGYNVESADITLVNPTRNGYTFAGWTGTDLTAATQTVTIAKGSTGNRSYVATWTPVTYTITYTLNGGTVATANPTEYTIESENITLNNPTRQGYAFAGWTGTGLDAATDTVTIETGSTGNRNYTATWTESTANYTVKHYRQDLDGNYPESLLETVVTGSTTGKTETAALKSYDGFTAPEAKTVTVLADGSATVEYYYTRNTYKIVYYTVNAADAQIEFKTIEALYEAPVTAVTEVPVRTGYEFTEWDVDCPAKMPLDGLEIVALWNPSTFTITYEGIYDDVSRYPATHTFDTETDISAVPARDGYTFAGWTFNGNPITFENNKIGKRQFSDNFTLTATWTANPTTYKVETYLMGTDGQYPQTATSFVQKDTVTDAEITATHETVTGFTADADKSIVKIDHAAFDGTSVLKLYYSRNQYDLTLEAGTGVASVTGDGKFYYEQSVTIGASLNAGYDWAKWTKGDADFATAQNYTFTMPAEALTLTANATVHTYNISIDLASGAFAADYTAPTTYQVTDADIAIPDPTRNGYTFNGWKVNGSAPQKSYTIDTAKAVDVELVADWTAIEYKITYVLGGGTNAATNPDKYTIESAEIKLAAPTKTGYEFIQWTEGDTIEAGSTGDKTFTAEWEALGVEYNIVTHFEGFTAGNYDSFENTKGSADADSTVRISAIAADKTGFTFEKATLTEGGEAVTVFENGTTDGEVTVHLYYTRNSYTLTFDTDGGTAVDEISYKYAAEVATPATTTKTGYTFAGWENLPEKMPANDMTAKAKWTINQYTITFANTGDSTIDPIAADYGTAITAPEDPTKTGYTFDGWDVEIPDTMPAENMTITAKWKINKYTITFNTDGGSEIAPITQDYATEITKPADPTKEGYTFTGWDTVIPEFMPASNVTVKALWKINQYTITFDSDGGSAVESITQDYATDITKPADPTKTGYTFDGWDVAIPDTMPAGDMIITAQWKINQYTITFDSNGGSAVNPIRQDYNSDVTAPTDPTRPGYTFKGWTPAVPATMPAENITLKAEWEIVTYKVSYIMNGGENHDDNPTAYTYEQTFELKAPTKVGYTFAGWTPSGTIALNSTGDKTFTANWTPNTDTPITVEYYIQPVKVNADLSEYTLHSTDKAQVGTSDAEKVVTPIGITGFATPAKQTVTVNADGSTVVKFYYTRNSYTVTFNSKGGSEVGSITALYEAPVTAPANPTKTGYTFKEWTPALAATMPVGGQTLEAVWTANEYEITYDYNVPENVTVKHEGDVPTAHTYGKATPVADPERAGYTFAGWTVNGTIAGGTNLTLAADGYTADITLKANWTADTKTYKVEFYYQDVNDMSSYICNGSETLTLDAKTDDLIEYIAPEKEGFVFNPEKSYMTGVVPAEDTLIIEVFYDRDSYTLTWEIDGVQTTEELCYGQTINYPENPTKTGYNFIGWTPANITTMPAEDITLTAQFAAADDTEYKVIHKLEDLNADTYFEKETELLYGTTATEVTPLVKSYEGFTAPTTQTVTIAADGSTVVEYLYKRNSYDVTIVATDAGLSNATASQKVEFEGTLNVSVTVANGYEFKGWTSNNEKVAGSENASYTITMPASDVTLTANAEIIEYTVSYNLDGGALADGKTNPTEFYVTTDTFTLNNPEKKGYTFLGWTGSNGTTAQTEVSVEQGTYQNLSYTANWALISYEIKYDLAGGSVAQANATQYFVTTADFTLNNPTRAGYTFTGWTGTGLDGKVETVTITKGSIGDRSYTATWEANDIATVVNYYWQNIDDNNYTLKDTVNGTVKNDTVFAPKVETYEGFVSPAAQSVKVENGVAVTIDYYYDRETHTVTLTAGTGIDSVSGAGTYRYGKEITVSAVVSTGYTWQNWTANGTEASAEQNYTITIGTADVALTANATLDTYTITYSGLDEYTTVTENPTSYNVHSDAIVLNNPAKDGYTFTGWTGTDLSDKTMTVTIPTGSVGNRSYIANWNRNTYNLTYDLAKGSLAQGDSIPATYTVDDIVTLPTPVRTGYTFKGWSDGTDTAMNVTLNRATGDRHYTAVWEANGDTKYTVKHYLMGLDGQYTATAYETKEFFDGTSDADITPAVNTYEGFTSPETQTVKVNPDGSTVVEYKYSRNKYALTYYTVEGQLLQTEDLYFGATIPVAPTATRDGYTFQEWNMTIPAKMPAHAVEITALWDVNTYTVSFDVNGGNALTAINYTIETAVTLPEATRSGYDFAGWTVNKTEGNWADSIAENNATLAAGLWGDVTLTANWTARQDTKYVVKHMFMNVDGTAYDEFKVENFTGTSDTTVTPAVLTGDAVIGFTAPEAREVTIAADGSTVVEYKYERNQYELTWKIKGSDDETVKYYYGAAVTAKANPVLAGHTFTGWSSEIPATMPAENITITANFDLITYTITIDYNGGKEVDNKTTYTVETETFTLINPTRDGYTFVGWEGTNNGETVTIAKGSTGDRNYKATWNADEQKWYVDVYYMTTEGKYNDAADENIEKTNVTDTPVSFDSATRLKDGFTFDAANSSISGTVPGTGELRLTAKYIRNQYTVTYIFANGTADKTVTTYYEADLAAVAEPTRTGYTFAGWYDANGNKVDALPENMPLNGGTYTAHWTANEYKLTFVENGGTAVEDIDYTIESTDVLPDISRAGYIFDGWLVTTAGGSWITADANYAAGTTLTGKYGSATLTAQWTARNDTTYVVKHLFMATDGKTYVEDETKRVNATGTSDTKVTPAVLTVTGFTSPAPSEVTIAADGSTVVEYKYSRNQYNLTWVIKGSADETVTYYYDAAVEAKADPELEGHTFTGWSRSIPATMPAEDVTITANFDLITYYISIDYNGAQAVNNPTEYNVETETITLINPTRDGYTFLGWTGSNGETPDTTVTIPVGSTGNKNYKAMWNADEKDWFVDVYYMNTDGEYGTPDESIKKTNVTDTEVSFDSATKLKDGFIFDAANSKLTGTVPGTGELHLIAKYIRNKYTVTYDFANGEAQKEVVNFFEADLEAVADPTRTGYTFTGWVNSKGESVTLPDKMPLNGETYTATWKANEYKLTLVENGGTAVEDIDYTIESADVLPAISRAGYFFEGWLVTTADGSWTTADANYAAGTALKGKYGDATLTAQWTTVQYTLEFNTTHGTVDPASITYTVEDTTNALPTPVRPGYTFAGWLVTEVKDDTQSPGYIYWTVDEVYDADTKLTDTYGNAKFTAQWQENTYKVTVDAANITYAGENEATVDQTYTATLTPAAGYTLPDTITLTIGGKDAIVNTDYTYTVNADGTATLVINGAAIIGDIAIKVVRNIITYTISYDLDKATTDPHNATTYNVETAVTLTAPERAGYTFLGWTGSNGETAQTEVTIPVGTTGDKNYVANWKANNQDWFVDVYYMNTEGEYNDAADESIKYTNVTDTPVSFNSDDRLLAGFVFDAAESNLNGTVPGTGTLRLTAKYIRQQYTVTYNFENGAENKVVKTWYDADLEAVADPTRTGYTFAGWLNSNGDKVTLPAKMPLNGETYTATWTANSYTLTLDENGGTEVEDITYTIESAAALPTLSRAGYAFAGWRVTTAGGSWTAGANHAAGTSLKGTHGTATLTAQWTPVQYTLAFNADKGTVDPASIAYNVEDAANVLPTPVRPGYTFTGWLVTEVSDDTQSPGYIYWTVDQVYDAGTKLTGTYGNAKFTAQWAENTYKVTVDAENIIYAGADNATVDHDYSATLTPEAGYTLPATITLTIGGKDAIVNTDYTYTVHADGTATLTVKGAAIIGDIAIKAERNIVTYNISYNLDNATTDPKNATTYNVETAVTLTAPERTGYTFLGWTGSNGTTAQKEVTIPVGTTGDKNYVANWQADPRQYTVEIYYMTTDGTYNSTPDKSWTVDSVTDAQVSYNINDPATLLTGFSANENISTLTGTVPATGALTLVAKYDRNKYALTVNGCEGITAAVGTVEYFYDKEIVVDATVAMGYTWVEWKSADETALAGSTDKKYTFKMPANAAELTAVAMLDVYDIGYDLAGGTLADGVTNPATYTVTTDTFTLNNPTKVGYDFIGWTGTDLATPTVNVTIAKNSTTGDKSYTANWKAIEYTVSYDLDKGTAQGNNYTVYTIETAAQTLTAPVKTGYTFLGWTGSNGTEPKTDVTIAGGTIGDLSFTANWSADAHTYTVEYRTQTIEGVYAEQPDKTETIDSYTDAEVSVAVTPDKGFYIADTSILSGTVKHDNSLVLKVYIGRHQYDVTLVDGGDGISSVNTNTTKVYFDAPVEVNAVVENGYTFEKWTSEDEAVLAGSENNPYTFDMPAGNVTLTASATLNRYNINYTMNGGTNNAANPTTYTVLDTINIKQPERLGYTFTGWSGSYYGKNVYISAGNTGDINLTANWSINTYTVTYDLAGGSVDGTNPETYNVHDSFTLINPTRVGYDFAGWTGSFAGENVTVPENTTGNLTFTANWRARNDTKYTVNFYIESVNGDNTYTLSDDSYVAEYVSDKDLTVTAPAVTGFATPVALTRKIAADGSTVFNFYYERNQYTYTFKAIGYEDIVKTYFYEYPITKPTDPTRAGYDFVNWNPVVVGTMPAHDVTSVAEWKAITYTIGYDLAGGSVSGNPTSYTVENGYTLLNPTRNGYEFAGWTGTGLTEPTMLVTVEAGNIGNRSYTATWTPVRYEITYDFAGGTDNGANPISYTIEDNITLVAPVKVGYTFTGWRGTGIAGTSFGVTIKNATGNRSYTATWRANNNTLYTVLHYQQDIGSNTYTLFETEEKFGTTMADVSPKVKTYPGFTSPSAKTVTILPDGSAKVEYYYTRNTYTIFFDSNGGSPVSSRTFAFGEELTGLETPSYLGYTFAGWTPALPATMTAGNLYVTADWKANTDTPYTVYHYFQDVDCVSYPEELMKVEYCYGETGAIVEVETWDVEGFTAPAKRSIVIAADGSRTVRYYYTRNTYTVTFVDHNDNIIELQSVVYGLPATPPALEDRAPDAEGHYTFAGWSEDTSFIHGYTTIKALYTAEAHKPGADADCTNALICTVCGYEIAPANGHMPVEQTPAVEATCTTSGNTADSVCSVCGEVLSRYHVVPALGHEIGSWFVEVPATTTETGVLKRVCSRCDWSETHEIPVLSDSPVVSIDITTSGSQAYVGTSYQLMTEITPANAVNKQVIWESSDPDVASVTADGFITSHKPGEVTFTVTTLDGLKTDSITVNFYYSANNYNLLILDLFACNIEIDGKPIEQSVGEVIRVKAGSTLAFTINPTTDEYLDKGGYIFTANGSNVEADANGVYYIYNVHENIEISALPAIGKPEFDDDQQYDTDKVPEKSIFAKILEFFERIAEWFRNLFK